MRHDGRRRGKRARGPAHASERASGEEAEAQTRPWRRRSSNARWLITLPWMSSHSTSWSGLKVCSSASFFNLSYSVIASSIFVISLKCEVLGIFRHLMPKACLHSEKCFSKERRPQYE